MIAEMYKNVKKFGCKFCLFEKRILTEGVSWFLYMEDLMNHLEMQHDLVIPRRGENEAQARNRVKIKGTRIGTPQCQCPMCKWNLRDSEITEQLIKDGLVIEKNHMTYIRELDEPMVEFVAPFPSANDSRKVK